MSVRIKVGNVWWTGAPGQPQSEITSAANFALGQRASGQEVTGHLWTAGVPFDAGNRGVVMSFSVSRRFATVLAKVQFLALIIAADGTVGKLPHQADIRIRWEHEDGVGYSESIAPWAAWQIVSIDEDGLTLRIICTVYAAELQEAAIYARPYLAAEDGTILTAEDGSALTAETYTLFEAP